MPVQMQGREIIQVYRSNLRLKKMVLILIACHIPLSFHYFILVPGPPSYLSCVAQTPRTAFIEWKAPLETNGIIKSYQLEVLGDNETSITPFNPDIFNFMAANLYPHSQYTVHVSAETSVGFGSFLSCSFSTEEASMLLFLCFYISLLDFII